MTDDKQVFEPKDRKVDVALALRAYQNVIDRGDRSGEGFVYEGLTASSDFDGYTVTLSDGVVSLRVLFHNKFQIEPTKGAAIDRFLTRLTRVASS